MQSRERWTPLDLFALLTRRTFEPPCGQAMTHLQTYSSLEEEEKRLLESLTKWQHIQSEAMEQLDSTLSGGSRAPSRPGTRQVHPPRSAHPPGLLRDTTSSHHPWPLAPRDTTPLTIPGPWPLMTRGRGPIRLHLWRTERPTAARPPRRRDGCRAHRHGAPRPRPRSSAMRCRGRCAACACGVETPPSPRRELRCSSPNAWRDAAILARVTARAETSARELRRVAVPASRPVRWRPVCARARRVVLKRRGRRTRKKVLLLQCDMPDCRASQGYSLQESDGSMNTTTWAHGSRGHAPASHAR
jgi:hypothetical protein